MRADTQFWSKQNLDNSLELDAPIAQPQQKEQNRLGDLIQSLLNWGAGNPEPIISQKRDRRGNVIWSVYDPSTQQYSTFASEAEVRIWLEQRYSH